MNTYNPKQWRILKITNNENQTHYRVYATWGNDEWRLSSGFDSLKDVLPTSVGFEIPQTSGSWYNLHKNGQDHEGDEPYWPGAYQRILGSVLGQDGTVERIFL